MEERAIETACPLGLSALLINSRSRLGHRAVDAVAGALSRQGLELDQIVRVRRPRRLGQEVETLLKRDLGRLIVGGGDGTIGTAAARLVGRPTWLGVIPLGTANDFARTLEIPSSIDLAAQIAAGSHVRPIDLAKANDAYFLNVASVGVSEAATHALSPRLKRWLGPFAYAVGGARTFLRHPTFRARLSSPAGNSEAIVHQVVIGNGRFYGGGVLVANDSVLDDGKLTVYTLGAGSRWQLLRTIALLRLGFPLERPGDIHWQTPIVRVETWPTRGVNLDGEVRTRTPVTFSVEPKALLVLTPWPNFPTPIDRRLQERSTTSETT